MSRFDARRVAQAVYEMPGPAGQAYLDRCRFATGLLPRVAPGQPPEAGHQLLPARSRAALVISADFELAWAWRYVRGRPDPLGYALQKARQARRNFGPLLALFDRYQVPVTWAAVGHLFLEECERTNGLAHADMERIPYFENEHWRYTSGDWFDDDPCSSWQSDPAWYAPDLIREIMQAEVQHEIACHGFSHVGFSDRVCPSGVADGELLQCRQAAERWGLQLKTFVFPGNMHGNLPSLKRFGFTAYRYHSHYHLGLPRRDSGGLWQIPGGMCWEKPERWPADAWIRALKRCVDRAVETRTLLHLWFHPSCDPINLKVVFPSLLEYILSCQTDLWMTTANGLVAWLTSTGE